MNTEIDKGTQIISHANNIQNKNLINAIFTKFCNELCNKFAPESRENIQMILNAYLKVFVESLADDNTITPEQFFEGFLKGLKKNQIYQSEDVAKVINTYSKNIKFIIRSMYYVDFIENTSAFNSIKKELLIQEINEFFMTLDSNLEKMLQHHPQVDYIKRALNIKINESLDQLLTRSDDLLWFKMSLLEVASEFIYKEEKSGRFNFISLLRDEQKAFLNSLDGTLYDIYKLLLIFYFTAGVQFKQVSIYKNSFISNKLGLSPEEVISSLLELEYKENKWEKEQKKLQI